MNRKKNRLEEIQDQLDVLMDEVHKLRENIADQKTRRRTYPFPFERAIARDNVGDASERSDADETTH